MDGELVGADEIQEHTFEKTGNHRVKLVVTDNSGVSSSKSFDVHVEDPIEVAIETNEFEGRPYEYISFSANVTGLIGDPASVEWDFGDGDTSLGTKPIHFYRDFGTYNVKVIVTDNYGNTAKDEIEVSINEQQSDQPPTANFTAIVDHDAREVSFDASKSLESGIKVNEYVWRLGDIEEVKTKESVLDYKFPSYGSYNVTLKTINSAGQDTMSREITVINFPVPDPGEAGRLTLEGVDSDGDGLRDDIQREVFAMTYKKQDARDIAESFARTYLKNASEAGNKELSVQLTKEVIDLERCLLGTLGPTTVNREKVQLLKARMFNTKERYLAWLRTRANFAGNITKVVDENEYLNYCSN